MKQLMRSKSVYWRALITGLFVLSLLGLTPQAALAQEPGDTPITTCLEVFNCTAQDFGDLAMFDHTSKSGCIDHDGNGTLEMLFDFTITYQAASATRYDIGAVVAVDGMPAQRLDADLPSSQCVRDYLPPPQTTLDNTSTWPVEINGTDYFWEGEDAPESAGDTCGDLPPRDTAYRTYTNVWVACVDNYNAITEQVGQDGSIDMNVCVFYDNNKQNACYDAEDATAGTTAKCGCDYYVTFPFSPTAVSLKDFGGRSSQGYLLGGLGLLMVVGASGSYWLYRKQTKTAA